MNPIEPVARQLWEQAGRPEGQSAAHWHEAEQVVMRWAMTRLVEAMLRSELVGPPFPTPSLGEMRRWPEQTAERLTAAALGIRRSGNGFAPLAERRPCTAPA